MIGFSLAGLPAAAQLTAPSNPNARVNEAINIVQAAADTAESLGNMAGRIARLAQRSKTVSTPGRLADQANSLLEQMDIILGDARFAGVNLIDAGAPDYVAQAPGGPYTVRATDLTTGALGLSGLDFGSTAKANATRQRALSAQALMATTMARYRRDIAALSKKRVKLATPNVRGDKPAPGGGGKAGQFDVQGLIDRLRNSAGQ